MFSGEGQWAYNVQWGEAQQAYNVQWGGTAGI